MHIVHVDCLVKTKNWGNNSKKLVVKNQKLADQNADLGNIQLISKYDQKLSCLECVIHFSFFIKKWIFYSFKNKNGETAFNPNLGVILRVRFLAGGK